MSDVIIQAQSTLFNRSGLTQQKKFYTDLPTELAGQAAALTARYGLSSTICSHEQGAMDLLLTQDKEIIPGGQTLFTIQSLNPALFIGAAELQALYQLNPFSTTYETSTNAVFARMFMLARAVAQSGPTNVRGSTERQAIELADLDTQQSINRFREVWQNQLAVAQLVINATQLANTAEGTRRSAMLQAQSQQAQTENSRSEQTLGAARQISSDKESSIRAIAAGMEFQTSQYMYTTESLNGQGFQSGVNTSFGNTTWR